MLAPRSIPQPDHPRDYAAPAHTPKPRQMARTTSFASPALPDATHSFSCDESCADVSAFKGACACGSHGPIGPP